MKLSEYSDDELLDEIHHRGFKIELRYPQDTPVIYIGGIRFDISR